MTPYYDEDGITIYHEDCAEVMWSLDSSDVSLVLTDPPYGISLATDYLARKRGHSKTDYLPVAGDDEPFDPRPLLAFGRCVLWGANNYAHLLPPSSAWIVWDALYGLWGSRDQGFSDARDAELAWTNLGGTVRTFRHRWNGHHRDSERSLYVHPTQKPVALMRWILDRWSEPGDLILDPYMGSGPVAQALQGDGPSLHRRRNRGALLRDRRSTSRSGGVGVWLEPC